MPQAPVAPDPEFNSRYSKTYRYAFLLEIPSNNKTVTQIIGNVSDAEGQYVELTLNPQQITVREPLATSVTIMQGGGKLVESRGGLMKDFIVSGTTGYLPPKSPAQATAGVSPAQFLPSTAKLRGSLNATDSSSLYDSSIAAERERSNRSGFAQFHKLRYLFRQFMYLRRIGTECYMHYLDFKGDEYWLIEPQNFSLNRDSRHPYTYQYNISFQGLEPTDVPKTVEESKASSPLQVIAAVTARLKAIIGAGVGYLKSLSGQLERDLQGVLSNLGDYVQFVADAGSTLQTLGYDLPSNLLSQCSSSVDGAFTALGSVITGAAAVTQLPDQTKMEYNEVLAEVKLLVYTAKTAHQQFSDSTSTSTDNLKQPFLEQRGLMGSSVDTFVPAPGSAASLFDASFLTDETSGINFNSNTQAATVQRVLSGETIYDVANRTLGSVHRALELIALNKLKHPYIVSDPKNKPPSTIAWGEYIYVTATPNSPISGGMEDVATPGVTYSGKVDETGTNNEAIQNTKDEAWRINQWVGYTITMISGTTFASGDVSRVVVSNDTNTLSLNRVWSVNPAVGDTFTLTLDTFTLRKAPDLLTELFGRDILLAFKSTGAQTVNPLVADVRVNSHRDLAMVAGQENFNQALILKLATERTKHPFHLTFGVGVPIGRRADEGQMLAYTYFVRQSLLSDVRVDAVISPQLLFEGGALMFQAFVRPVGLKQNKFVKVTI